MAATLSTHLDNDRVILLVKIPTGMISSLTAELAAEMWRETRVLIGLVIERLKILLRNNLDRYVSYSLAIHIFYSCNILIDICIYMHMKNKT